MKVVLLAGGYGSRLADDLELKPKPMIEIGGRPVLWHLMMYYSWYGYKDFVITLGYKGEMIKRYMVDYCSLHSNITINLGNGDVKVHDGPKPDWKVDLIDTGIQTKTGGRLKRVAPFLGNETFMMTWGDSLSNVDLNHLVEFHRSHGKLATVTTVHPTARYGYMLFEGDQVLEFSENPQIGEGWINGAFFVLEPGVIDYIEGDETVWESQPLMRLAQDGQLMAYRHKSFWQALDTMREKHILESLWQAGEAPWKKWEG
jgi:glucose-1-phosphate cytidylyltransferase